MPKSNNSRMFHTGRGSFVTCTLFNMQYSYQVLQCQCSSHSLLAQSLLQPILAVTQVHFPGPTQTASLLISNNVLPDRSIRPHITQLCQKLQCSITAHGSGWLTVWFCFSFCTVWAVHCC